MNISELAAIFKFLEENGQGNKPISTGDDIIYLPYIDKMGVVDRLQDMYPNNIIIEEDGHSAYFYV